MKMAVASRLVSPAFPRSDLASASRGLGGRTRWTPAPAPAPQAERSGGTEQARRRVGGGKLLFAQSPTRSRPAPLRRAMGPVNSNDVARGSLLLCKMRSEPRSAVCPNNHRHVGNVGWEPRWSSTITQRSPLVQQPPGPAHKLAHRRAEEHTAAADLPRTGTAFNCLPRPSLGADVAVSPIARGTHFVKREARTSEGLVSALPCKVRAVTLATSGGRYRGVRVARMGRLRLLLRALHFRVQLSSARRPPERRPSQWVLKSAW